MKALTFEKFGGPEVLQYRDVPDPLERSGCVIVTMKAVGLNYADIYRRKGNYHLSGQPPFIAGYEGAGVIEWVADDVQGYQAGDRVGFADVPYANAEKVLVPADHLIPLPEGISFATAAASLLQGLTAHYLCTDSYRVKAGDDVLVHAAAGGVGSLLTQMIRFQGGNVFGLTSNEEKRSAILSSGVEHCALYSESWVQKAVDCSRSGEGMDAAFDSVGSTLAESFASVRPKGTVVFYGMAGGDPQPVDPRMLMDTSKTLTGGDLWSYLTSHEERVKRAGILFQWILDENLKITEPVCYALAEGKEAHLYLESRKSTGKILLIP
ncbi:quinone oxidoreductase family protein [Paenibacillus gansuensis]|uniref:Quinone oxidoreductase family protein n=1 Tax=Paenibacillus gansuensis TaxID=306542 RepID=A0ABW5PDP0_9BACL